MRRIGRVGGRVLLAALCAGAGPLPDAALYKAAEVAPPRDPRPAPDFTLRAPDGASVALADLRGKVVVLNFWATWCRPCVKELPALQALADRHGGEGLDVVAVNVDRDDPGDVAGYGHRLGLSFALPLDPKGAVRGAYRVRALPTTYLIGRDGRLAGFAMGERPWDGPAAEALVRALLERAPP
jgi:peroxiredoxin